MLQTMDGMPVEITWGLREDADILDTSQRFLAYGIRLVQARMFHAQPESQDQQAQEEQTGCSIEMLRTKSRMPPMGLAIRS